jgi:LmbE family N-acetylglucosaminyl deacetylase
VHNNAFSLLLSQLKLQRINMNILAIGAHPDDIELGCGGLILKAARNGHNVYMYTLTRGEAAGNPNQREQELIQSSKFIGAKALWIDKFYDTHLDANNSDLINHIEIFINKAHADLVITHSLNDTHHDHRAVAAATREAGRFVPNMMAYEIPLTKEFNPQMFYDISDVVDEKVSLIELFKSQRDKVYLHASAIKGLAAYRALQSRLNFSTMLPEPVHVEAFETMKMCIDNTFKLSHNKFTELSESRPIVSSPKGIVEFPYQV